MVEAWKDYAITTAPFVQDVFCYHFSIGNDPLPDNVPAGGVACSDARELFGLFYASVLRFYHKHTRDI